jgi:glycosyltransferase involved in cell wall biosynthesis
VIPSHHVPLVSVVIPCFNDAAFVGDALASLSAQTLADWECIVVDDGSTDDTAAVVAAQAEADERIRYLWQVNRGLSAARNAGLAVSRGRYVQFLDADDMLESRKLEVHVDTLTQHAAVAIVYGAAYKIPQQWDGVRASDKRPFDTGSRVAGRGRVVIEALVESNIMPVNAALVRTTTFESVGVFDPTLRGVQDWDLWLRCALGGCQFRFVDAPAAAALVRRYPGSMTGDHRLMIEDELEFRRRVAPMLPRDLRRRSRRAGANRERQLGLLDLKAGRRTKAVRHLVRATWWAPDWRRRTRWAARTIAAAVSPRPRDQTLFPPDESRAG